MHLISVCVCVCMRSCTILGILINVEIEREEVPWQGFLFWQTLQQEHKLSLAQSLQPVGAQTPAALLAV